MNNYILIALGIVGLLIIELTFVLCKAASLEDYRNEKTEEAYKSAKDHTKEP